MVSIRPEEDRELREILTSLADESNAKICFLIDKSGQLISRSTSPEFTSDDITFASLTAGSVAASEALSKLLGDKTLNHSFTETEEEGVYMSLVSGKYIVVVIFDKRMSNLGIVRVKLKRYMPKIEEIVRGIERRLEEESKTSKGIDLGDIDIDELFT